MPDLGQMMPAAEQVEQIKAALPIWADIAVAVLGLWGLFIWLFGRRVMRLTFTLAGLLVGAAVGALVFARFWPSLPVLPWAIGGALIGAVVSWAMFRLWAALALAVTLAVMAPWAMAAWEGQIGPPEAAAAAEQSAEQLQAEGSNELGRVVEDAVRRTVERIGEAANGQAGTGGADHPDDSPMDPVMGSPRDQADDGQPDSAEDQPGPIQRVVRVARQEIDRHVQLWRNWWGELPGTVRWTIMALSAVGAVVGLIVGFVVPNLSAALVASLIGAVLMLFSITHLGSYLGESAAAYLPDTPRQTLVILMVATAVGTAFQWIFSIRKADKQR